MLLNTILKLATLPPLFWMAIYNYNNRTKWSSIWSVIICVINKITIWLPVDRIEWQEVLLPINHNDFNFQKKIYRYLKQISPVETMSLVKNSSIFWNSPVFLWICGCCYLMFILIISAIGGLAEWTYYDWLLQLSNNRCPIKATCLITLSSYNCTEWLVKNEAANAPIIFEEFVMVVINVIITLNLICSIASCT